MKKVLFSSKFNNIKNNIKGLCGDGFRNIESFLDDF